jgi:hypothetical protein
LQFLIFLIIFIYFQYFFLSFLLLFFMWFSSSDKSHIHFPFHFWNSTQKLFLFCFSLLFLKTKHFIWFLKKLLFCFCFSGIFYFFVSLYCKPKRLYFLWTIVVKFWTFYCTCFWVFLCFKSFCFNQTEALVVLFLSCVEFFCSRDWSLYKTKTWLLFWSSRDLNCDGDNTGKVAEKFWFCWWSWLQVLLHAKI